MQPNPHPNLGCLYPRRPLTAVCVAYKLTLVFRFCFTAHFPGIAAYYIISSRLWKTLFKLLSNPISVNVRNGSGVE